MNRTRIVFTLFFVFLIITVIAKAQSSTPPPLPAAFYGSLTVNNQPAPTGIVIIAKIDNEERGSITTSTPGSYGGPNGLDPKLLVSGNDEDNGKEIKFFINGKEADQSATWKTGEIFNLDISVSDLSILTTTTTPSDGGGGGGGGGGGSSIQPIIHNLGDIRLGGNAVANNRDIVLFLVKNNQHSTTINFVGNNYVELTIRSTPIASKLTLGESKQFDLDDNNINDLEITLNNVISRKASLTFREIQSTSIASEEQPSIEESEPTGLEGITGEAVRQTDRGNAALGIGIVIAILIIGIIGYFSMRKRE